MNINDSAESTRACVFRVEAAAAILIHRDAAIVSRARGIREVEATPRSDSLWRLLFNRSARKIHAKTHPARRDAAAAAAVSVSC